jgi:hypothetical protein
MIPTRLPSLRDYWVIAPTIAGIGIPGYHLPLLRN